ADVEGARRLGDGVALLGDQLHRLDLELAGVLSPLSSHGGPPEWKFTPLTLCPPFLGRFNRPQERPKPRSTDRRCGTPRLALSVSCAHGGQETGSSPQKRSQSRRKWRRSCDTRAGLIRCLSAASRVRSPFIRSRASRRSRRVSLRNQSG